MSLSYILLFVYTNIGLRLSFLQLNIEVLNFLQLNTFNAFQISYLSNSSHFFLEFLKIIFKLSFWIFTFFIFSI